MTFYLNFNFQRVNALAKTNKTCIRSTRILPPYKLHKLHKLYGGNRITFSYILLDVVVIFAKFDVRRRRRICILKHGVCCGVLCERETRCRKLNNNFSRQNSSTPNSTIRYERAFKLKNVFANKFRFVLILPY